MGWTAAAFSYSKVRRKPWGSSALEKPGEHVCVSTRVCVCVCSVRVCWGGGGNWAKAVGIPL